MPSLKRKSNPSAPHAPCKRPRTAGLFTPRVKAPTGLRRAVPRASRYSLPTHRPTKRSLSERESSPPPGQEEETEEESQCSSKVRILNNRDCLFLLPSRRRPTAATKPRKTAKPRSPVRSAVIARLARRKSFLAASASRMRQLEPMDSEDDNVCYFSEGVASEDVKLFTAVSSTSFSSFSVDIPDMEMDLEVPPPNCTTTTTDIPSNPDSDPPPPREEKKVEDDKAEAEEVKDGEVKDEQVKDEEVKDEEVKDEKVKDEKEESNKEENKDDPPAQGVLSVKDKLVNERIKKRLGEDGMVRLGGPKTKKVEETTPEKPRTVMRKARTVLPPTLEEDEESEEEQPKKRSTKSSSSSPRKIREPVDDETESEREERPKRRSSRFSIRKTEKEEKKEEEKEREAPKLKATRQKATREDSSSDSSDDSEREEEKPKSEEATPKSEKDVPLPEGSHTKSAEEEGIPSPDKMEEDADSDSTSDLGSSGEDTDMSSDADEAQPGPGEEEEVEQEDVAMSEDSDDGEEGSSEGPDRQLEEEQKEMEKEKDRQEDKEEEQQEQDDDADADGEDSKRPPVLAKGSSEEGGAKQTKKVSTLVLSPNPGASTEGTLHLPLSPKDANSNPPSTIFTSSSHRIHLTTLPVSDSTTATPTLSTPSTANTPSTPATATTTTTTTLRYNFSISKTPKSPRSPRLFKHDLVPSSPLGFGFGKKKKKPEIERDANIWMVGKPGVAMHQKRRRQLPFNPANVSRHAYRDSDSDDGEDMYTPHHHHHHHIHHHCGFQTPTLWDADAVDEDELYLRVGWGWEGTGMYNSWMMEHGGALLEFCVNKLEGFNMAW